MSATLMLLVASALAAAAPGKRVLAAVPTLESFLAEQQAAHPVPGLAVGIVTEEGLLWSKGYGAREQGGKEPVTAATVFRIGSITKVLTGMALLQLRDEGKLQLDDPAAKYLPELGKVVAPTKDSPPITLRHLVTHSSGLPRLGPFDYTKGDRPVTEAELLGGLDGMRLEFSPGTESRYSNLGMALAGEIVQRAGGQRFRDYVTARLLLPLGMRATVWEPEAVPRGRLAAGYRLKDGAYVPAGPHWRLGAAEAMGGLYSSVEDLAKLASFELGAWPPRDAPETGPLRRSALRESQLVAGAGAAAGQGYGVNWAVSQDAELGHLVAHNGATEGYSAALLLLPRRGLGVVVLASTGGEEGPAVDDLARKLLAKVAAAAAQPEPAMSPALQAGAAHVKDLLEHPGQESVIRAFSPRFLAKLPPMALAALAQHIHGKVGACGAAHPQSIDGETKATLRLSCERGAVEAQIAVEPEAPHQLTLLNLHPAQE